MHPSALRSFARPVLARATVRSCTIAGFHSSSAFRVNVGDRIPDVELDEDKPGNKIRLADELKDGGLLIGVPAAFSPTCSNTHIPDYIKSSKLSNANGPIFVVTVNDAFVTNAWADSLDPGRKSGIRFLADPSLVLTRALKLDFNDAAAVFGGARSVRYALVVKDGKVAAAHIEPDKTGLTISAVDHVL